MIGNVLCSVARTSQPWELEIDTVVVSVGGGLGRLGLALKERFPQSPWDAIQFYPVRGKKPTMLFLAASGSVAPPLRRAILVALSDVTDDSLRFAATSAIDAAVANGTKALGFPLLGTGTLAEPADRVAAVLVPAIVEAVQALSRNSLDHLVFLCQTAAHEQLIVREFRRLSRTIGTELAGGTARDLVDPNKGLPLSSDQLGFAPYVGMLATVIADRTTPLPLSIGIFGEWGSGKSPFMALMRERVRILAGSDSRRYCDQIAQIGFNAWHYADTNLWASLGDEIFRQLAGPDFDPKEHAKQIRTELAEHLDQRDQLELLTEQAGATAARLQANVDRAIAERKTTAGDLLTALRASPVFGSRIKEMWRQLGVSDEVEQAQLFSAQLHGTLTEADELRRGASERWGRLSLAVAGILLVAGVVVVKFAPEIRQWVGPVLGFLTLFGSGTGIWLLTRTRAGLRNLREVTEDVQSQLSRVTKDAAAKELADKLAELRTAEAEQRVAQAQLDDVVVHVGELGRQLAQLAPGRRLYSFLADRAQGDSYSGNLGLVSTIRKDLAQLVRLMDDWRKHPEEWAGSHRPADRIVLYIDDLDRCRPDQVVAVLQAVHLLLAFELFVVVVGVDPRWLLRSLRSQYADLLHDGIAGDPADDWHTPEDYLEKILNIPLALPTMSEGSLGRLLRSIDQGEVEPPAQTEQAVTQPDPRRPDLPNNIYTDGGSIVIEPGSEVDTQQRVITEVPRPLTEPELALLTSLDLLIETPREAKRVFNLYRMVRATRDLSDASRFLGTDGRPGEYQAVVLLLGLLTAHARLLCGVLDTPPDPSNDVDGGIARRPPHAPWSQFVLDLEPLRSATGWSNRVVGDFPNAHLPHWIRLHRGLAKVSEDVSLPDLSVLQAWLPRIRRFSYVLMTTNVADATVGK
ncbi:P-loop NTPase fold protein [Nocardia sp. CA-128927]|uniref:P-loop NTPase fold protein n=1 Tax=Nocardia sp. CA-128927 TaxID=3239975 RepID=UPI003D98271F